MWPVSLTTAFVVVTPVSSLNAVPVNMFGVMDVETRS